MGKWILYFGLVASLPASSIYWSSATASPTSLSLDFAVSLNNSSTVVGYTGGQAAETSVSSPTVILLGAPGASSVAVGINDSGQIAGTYEDQNGYLYAFSWTASSSRFKWLGPHNESQFCGSPIAADGKLITVVGVGGQNGYQYNNWQVTMYRASPAKYEQMGIFAPGLDPLDAPGAGRRPSARAHGTRNLLLRPRPARAVPRQDRGAKDKVTFVFQQTGGGITAGDLAKDVQITGDGAPKPAAAKVEGDTVVVDIQDVPLPFAIACAAGNTLAGKNNKPLPGSAGTGRAT